MNQFMEHIAIIQALISTGAGILGVGVGIGIFKGTIKQLKSDLSDVITKQEILRTGFDGGLPLFMTRTTCERMREDCSLGRNKQTDTIVDEIAGHTRVIKNLDNFARWWMQKEGLRISEINEILGK